jgi:hypothetical protein
MQKMTKVDRMGVLVLMSHLIITLAVLGLYAYFVHMGKDTTSVETIILVIIGYWFGAIGKETIRPTQQTQIHQAKEVKVAPENTDIKEGV